MSNYPAQIDGTQSLPIVVDNVTPANASLINGLRSAIIAIEQSLGINPAGVYGTMVARLSALENTVGNISVISLAQDLGGTLTEPLVIGIQGRPVSNATPTGSQVLAWNGIAWAPTSITGGGLITFSRDLSGNASAQTVVGIQGRTISANAPTVNQVLTWNGITWLPNIITMINGASVPVSGSLVTGNTLQVSGSSALSYAPINLAGGSNFVSGILPIANQANQNLAGDVTGTTNASVVAKIQAIPVSNTAPTNRQALVYNGTQYVAVGLQIVFNVKSYGAVGNGSTNDTTAVQNAINAAAAANGTLYFPTGIYLCGALTMSHIYGMSVKGEHSTYGPFTGLANSTGSVIKWTGGVGTLLTMTDCQDICFDQIHFYGTNNLTDVNNFGLAVVSDNDPASYYLTFERCLWSEWGTCVTWGTNPFQCDKGGFRDCEFWQYTRYGIYINSANALDAGHIAGCTFVGAPGPGDTNVAVAIYVFWSGFLSITDCLGGGIHKYFIQINASLANDVVIQNCESESAVGSVMIYISGGNDAQVYTLIGNSITGGVYLGGVVRVVGIGNTYSYGTTVNGEFPNDGSYALILDGGGVKYQSYGDRFDSENGPNCTVYITPNGGYYTNQSLVNAAAYNEPWAVGNITWQPTNLNTGLATGTAAEQCIRSGRRCQVWQHTTYANKAFVQATVDNGHVFINNGGTGTTGVTEPSWNTAAGGTTVDGSVTWTEDGYSAAFANWGPLNHLTGTVAPTTGYYTRGAVCWNTAPVIGNTSPLGFYNGSYVGWVCITTGNPGTWVPFGQLGLATNTLSVTTGDGYAPLGYNNWASSTTLTGNVNINLIGQGVSSDGAQWILDASNVNLNGHTITAKLNGAPWGTTIGTTGAYLLYSIGTGYLGGTLLTV